MIDLDVFNLWITALSERFKQPLSVPTQTLYYDRLSPRLTTEQFIKSAEALFDSQAERLPGVMEWASLARELCPDKQLPPAPEPPAFQELEPEHQAEWVQAKERARELVLSGVSASPWKSVVFATVGASVAIPGVDIPAAPTLAEEIQQKTQWLKSGDRILTAEAIEWVNSREDVILQFDELGNPAAITEVEF